MTCRKMVFYDMYNSKKMHLCVLYSKHYNMASTELVVLKVINGFGQ